MSAAGLPSRNLIGSLLYVPHHLTVNNVLSTSLNKTFPSFHIYYLKRIFLRQLPIVLQIPLKDKPLHTKHIFLFKIPVCMSMHLVSF